MGLGTDLELHGGTNFCVDTGKKIGFKHLNKKREPYQIATT